eukprot:TRINITY_DN2593_c0_g1_i1.p1 TRINITY_DN2593_c0_g1~~TRINITY_DN2593_c0_g1_i1.p1  ORF type:complete len:198 (+),score=88.73 TRINITY_DN2593_c0_g1_i1:194-787(+)
MLHPPSSSFSALSSAYSSTSSSILSRHTSNLSNSSTNSQNQQQQHSSSGLLSSYSSTSSALSPSAFPSSSSLSSSSSSSSSSLMNAPSGLAQYFERKDKRLKQKEVKTETLFVDLSEDNRAIVLSIIQNAYLSKDKRQDGVYWKDIAQTIKQELDTKLGPTWHVIVGSSFGSFITNETRKVMFVQINNMKILVFKHG